MFTSGTTGRPKGACLTHLGILTALKTIEYSSAIIGAQLAAKYGIDLRTLAANRPQPCTLLMFPLFHVSGCYSVFLSNLLQGGKIVMMPRWDVEQAMQHIQSEQVTTFPGVPTMYWDLLNHADRDQFDLRSLASLSVAGQSTPLTLLQSIHEAFPAAVVGCGYGMTETNGPVSMIIGEDLLAAPNSVGRAVATSEIKLRKDDGNWAAQGQRGEVCVRGAIVMKGYDNQDEANRKAFSDGWFATGDIGVFDDQERLQIVDRATEMVISAGENIYCAEVERVIDQAPDVIEVATIGAADERLGEKLIAFIRTREESDQTVESILDAASDQLASYKLPAETFLVDEPLPRNATGKILKIELRERYRLLTENRHS
jgi:acyl-CoA synthetase (AMP-forming)/AMP-acid ligase II